ncbi:unnamed protein product, partial [Symbiodinium sp. CCMP2456]
PPVVPRRPVLQRARTAPEAQFEVPFARELLSTEEPFAAIEDVAPTSPVTAAIERHRGSEPQVAVVRRVALGRPASAGDLRAVSQSTTGTSRPQLRRAQTTDVDTIEKVDVQLRRLSREEFDQRRANAVNYFKESTAINQLSRFSEASAALEAARRRRASDRAVKPVAVPEVLEEPVPAEAPTVAPPPRRRSFAEQFGYGVILKTTPTERQAQVLPEPPKPKMNGAFISLMAGDTDLLRRLERRRRAASLGA